MIWEVILDSLLDTIKVLPILYLVYLLISYLGHNGNNKYARLMNRTKKFGPVVGGITGSLPQCGFSIVMSDLYSKRAITLGTLFAVFIATSDEALPLMIADPNFICHDCNKSCFCNFNRIYCGFFDKACWEKTNDRYQSF